MNDKNFYIMLADTPWAGPNANLLDGPEVTMDDGVFIDGVDKRFQFLLTVDSKADSQDFPPCDIHDPSRHLLFSQRFIELLKEQGIDNIQYFDADVVYEPTGQKLAYKVANIVGIVSGLDRDQSDIIVSDQGNVLDIEEMVLDEDRLQGQKICRLQEDIMLIVVHKSIKEAVEKAGLTGFMFVTDEEYAPGMI